MVKAKIRSIELELQNGEMHRFVDEAPYYIDVGLMPNGNRVLFYYADASQIVNYVDTIIEMLPDFAAEYLESVLNSNKDVLVRLWYVPGSDSANYEIYYDCTVQGVKSDDLILWMSKNNDFDGITYRFTEVREGKQYCIGNN